MDDLTARALHNQNNANAAYYSKLQREAEAKQLTEAPAFITGFEGGKYRVQRLGEDPVAVGVPVTNGILLPGQRVTTTGQYVDGVPRVKPVVPTVPVVAAKGKIKYLYSIVADGVTSFYVGGWQKQSKLVKQFDPTYSSFFGALDNLGGDRWSANFSYFKDGKYYAEYLPSAGDGWVLEAPVPPVSFGHGFWRADNVVVNDSGGTLVIDSPSQLTRTLYDHQETEFWYAWGGIVFTAARQVTHDLLDVGIQSGLTETSGGYPISDVTAYDRRIYDVIFLPIDDSLSGKTFAYSSDGRITAHEDSTSGVTVGSYTCSQVDALNTLLKVDATGTAAVGFHNTYSVSNAGGSGSYTGCPANTQPNYATLYTETGAAISTDTTDLTAFYLDLKGASLTGMQKNQAYLGNNTDADKKFEVTKFSSTFAQSKQQYNVFKPSVSGSSFTFRSASYYP